jgi:hypothetical protein
VPKRSSYSIVECDFAVSLLKSKSCFSADQASSQTTDSNSSSVSQILSPATDSNASGANCSSLPHSVVDMQLTSSEKNALCYLTGWIAFKLKAKLKSCSACINFLVSSNPGDVRVSADST